MSDTTPEEFRDVWNREVGQLERLKFSLHPDDHAEERERLDEVKEELKDIIEVASESDW